MTMKTISKYTLCILTLLLLLPLSGADEKRGALAIDKDDASPSPEAAVRDLIEKGNLEEAASLIDKIEGNDYAIFCFKGIIALKRGRPEKAIAHFQKAAKIDGSRPELHLFLSQAYYKIGDERKTLAALVQGEAAGKTHASYYLFRGRVEMSLEAYASSYDTLLKGVKRFPAESGFLRELAVVLIRAGLYAAAVEYAWAYNEKVPADKEGVLVIAHTLREAGRPREAAAVLEEATLRHSDDPEISAALGHAYGQAGKHHAAAHFSERAALRDPSHAFDAAEHYMSAGNWKKASEMNLLVANRQKRLSQRLSLYLRQRSFERAAVIGEQMKKERLLDDRDRYCLAFAYAQLGRFDKAASSAQAIKTSKWREMAATLLHEKSG
jgi:predicted Zn-dependent protease